MKMTRSWTCSSGRQLPEGLGHEAGLQAHLGVAHLALDLGLGNQGRDRVDDDDVDGAGADEHLGDLEGLLARVGLGDEEVVGVTPSFLRVVRVERVLRVDERREAARLLGFGDDVEGESRLAAATRGRRSRRRGRAGCRRCRAPCRARAIRWGSRRGHSVSSPRRMIEPLPNCRSIWGMASQCLLPVPPARSGLDLLFAAMGEKLSGLVRPAGISRTVQARLSFGPAGPPPAVIDGTRYASPLTFLPGTVWHPAPRGYSWPFSPAPVRVHLHSTTIERTCIRSWATRRKRRQKIQEMQASPGPGLQDLGWPAEPELPRNWEDLDLELPCTLRLAGTGGGSRGAEQG